MADTCIVCLGDFAVQVEPTLATLDASLAHDSLGTGADSERPPPIVAKLASPPSEPLINDDELVAHLLPCGHNLHNECLKPWVERTNSCPICRASFNTVELSRSVGGPALSSYAVQDKQQVADLDLSMIVEEDYLEDGRSYDVCMVCDELGDSDELMICNSCDQLCHVFCAGLDGMPSQGPWYCQVCMENPHLLAQAAGRNRNRGPAAFLRNTTRRLPRHRRTRTPDEWVDVWQNVWNRLHLDLDFPFDDDDEPGPSERPDALQREMQEWERRLEVARQNGAGNRFRATNTVLRQQAPKTPVDPECQEELRAWNAFEKARAQLERRPSGGSSRGSRRHRKRKSVDSSPCESEPRAPERKLKRPRTRIPVEQGESSAAGALRSTHDKSPADGARDNSDSAVVATGFLQSLLKEVEVNRDEESELVAPQPKRIIVNRACSPQGSSPGLSPVYPTPRAGTPPPPLTLNRPISPQQQTSPQHSPTYSPGPHFSPYSPVDREHRDGRRRQPLSSPPRSKDSSPTRSALSYSTKYELQRMVTVALKPRYVKKEVTKDEYTIINRDVSRLLYDRVGTSGAAALADHETREKWQQTAESEVETAIKALRSASGSASSAGDDSASSS